MGYDELIHEVSDLCGILPEYWDISGRKHITSLETKKAILRAMKLKIDSEKDLLNEINKRRQRPWKDFIEPVHVVPVNSQPLSTPVYIPVEKEEEAKLVISWSIADEEGNREEFRLAPDNLGGAPEQWIEGTRYIKVMLSDTVRRAPGYYVLEAECMHPDSIFPRGRTRLRGKSKVIITPDTCYMPPPLRTGRAWGLYVNLYALRSGRNWGIGDLTDLRNILKWTSDMKGSFVGISPLHVIPNTKPFGVSPYSPISRLYRNFIYLDLERVPEITECGETRKLVGSKKFRKELDKLREANLVDYEKISALKEKTLRTAFDFFYRKHFSRKTARGREFKKYVREEGACLESFSLFMALREYMKKTKKAHSWMEWPEVYHDAAGKAARSFRKTHAKSILFYQYVQWLIDRQLVEIAGEAKKLGMRVGLYYDLAIGSVRGGSDGWNYKDVIARGADVGAPPDDFSPEGQKWGFPPLIPEELRETGYELFIETIRRNMRHGGAIRIDHALGLFRLFWVPDGVPAGHGAYVNYPSEDLLRIVALESVRNECMVVGEDLGTVGENVREGLKRFQMLSYKLFYFERNYPDPSFLPPGRYPETAICAVTTHDLPTLYGYWIGKDIQARRDLGKFPDDSVRRKQAEERERDKGLILDALKSQGKVPDDYPSDPLMVRKMTPELCLAIYGYLAQTRCKLLLVSLDDIIGTISQQNIPGVVGSYPNWMQKTRVTIEKMAEDRRFSDLSEMLNSHFGANARNKKN